MSTESDADETLGGLVQRYVAEQCGVILENWEPLGRREAESVHPARVAVRRLRATLRTFRRVYDAQAAEEFAAELRWWGLVLGGVRDLQVLGERFAPDEDPRTPRGRVELYLAAEIARELDSAWRATSDAMTSERATRLHDAVGRWHRSPPFGDDADRRPERARKRVKKADAKLRKRLERVREAAAAGDPGAADLLHSARKAAKRHRYALELAEPVLGAGADEEIERRRELQDAFGEHQDAVVAAEFLERRNVAGEPPEVAFALGELTEATRRQAHDVRGPLDAVRD